jgi:hypothetical protein
MYGPEHAREQARCLLNRVDADAPDTVTRNRDDIPRHLDDTVTALAALRSTIFDLLLDLESNEESRVWMALDRLGGSGIGGSTPNLVAGAVKAQTAAARTVATVEAVLFEGNRA